MLQGPRNECLARHRAIMAQVKSGGCQSHGHHQKFIALLILCFLDCGHGDGKGEFALGHLFTRWPLCRGAASAVVSQFDLMTTVFRMRNTSCTKLPKFHNQRNPERLARPSNYNEIA